MDNTQNTGLTRAETLRIRAVVGGTFPIMRRLVSRWTNPSPGNFPTPSALISITMAAELNQYYNRPSTEIQRIIREEIERHAETEPSTTRWFNPPQPQYASWVRRATNPNPLQNLTQLVANLAPNPRISPLNSPTTTPSSIPPVTIQTQINPPRIPQNSVPPIITAPAVIAAPENNASLPLPTTNPTTLTTSTTTPLIASTPDRFTPLGVNRDLQNRLDRNRSRVETEIPMQNNVQNTPRFILPRPRRETARMGISSLPIPPNLTHPLTPPNYRMPNPENIPERPQTPRQPSGPLANSLTLPIVTVTEQRTGPFPSYLPLNNSTPAELTDPHPHWITQLMPQGWTVERTPNGNYLIPTTNPQSIPVPTSNPIPTNCPPFDINSPSFDSSTLSRTEAFALGFATPPEERTARATLAQAADLVRQQTITINMNDNIPGPSQNSTPNPSQNSNTRRPRQRRHPAIRRERRVQTPGPPENNNRERSPPNPLPQTLPNQIPNPPPFGPNPQPPQNPARIVNPEVRTFNRIHDPWASPMSEDTDEEQAEGLPMDQLVYPSVCTICRVHRSVIRPPCGHYICGHCPRQIQNRDRTYGYFRCPYCRARCTENTCRIMNSSLSIVPLRNRPENVLSPMRQMLDRQAQENRERTLARNALENQETRAQLIAPNTPPPYYPAPNQEYDDVSSDEI